MTAIAFAAYATPRPQGSKRHVGGGRMVEQVQGLPDWRNAVKFAALEAMPAGWVPLGGTPSGVKPKVFVPLIAKVVFTVDRPGSARAADLRPCKTPDLSKLLRSTEDACTDAGVWVDDGRVAEYGRLAKVWWGYDDDALPRPGVALAVGEAADEVLHAFAWLLRTERERMAVAS